MKIRPRCIDIEEDKAGMAVKWQTKTAHFD